MELLDFDDDDLDKKIQETLDSDYEIRLRLMQLMPFLNNWNERIALGLNAYAIDDEDEGCLSKIVPRYFDYSPILNQCILLANRLSPQGRAELAVDILSEDWELGPVAV